MKKNISIMLTVEQIKALDGLVKTNKYFANRSHAIRIAVERLLEEEKR